MKKVNKVIGLLITCLVFYIIAGCSDNKPIFLPDELPIGIKGVPYYAEITIDTDTPVANFWWDESPNNNLFINNISESGARKFNKLKLFGTPLKSGETKITIDGITFGTSSQGQSFKKIYILKVKETD